MKKKHFLLLLLVVLGGLTFLSAQESVTLYGIRGPSGIGLVRLFDQPPRVPGMEIKVEALAQADLVAARIISGEAKIGILPPNVAAKIAASGRDIQVAAVIGRGMLSLFSADASVQSFADLKGKTVAVAGGGATPEYVLRRILLSYGIDPGADIQLDYSLAPPEIAQSLIAGRITTGIIPEPFATLVRAGRPNIRQIGDVQEEWIRAVGGAVGGENYPMTVIVVDAAFAREQPGVFRAVLNACRSSIEWVLAHPAEAGALTEKLDWGLRAPVAAMAIPRSNYAYIQAASARASLEALYRTFLEFSPESIGGRLPEDKFYYHLPGSFRE
ncbi:MAG: ABC transporter substrate-binding protein [Spirochaetaceae bacterium]|jgi:NitT/TauT family transport system substrate-binding protein|nr:ABC transporter substrate-binding protein [Spirochaetaceae bacterium]